MPESHPVWCGGHASFVCAGNGGVLLDRRDGRMLELDRPAAVGVEALRNGSDVRTAARSLAAELGLPVERLHADLGALADRIAAWSDEGVRPAHSYELLLGEKGNGAAKPWASAEVVEALGVGVRMVAGDDASAGAIESVVVDLPPSVEAVREIRVDSASPGRFCATIDGHLVIHNATVGDLRAEVAAVLTYVAGAGRPPTPSPQAVLHGSAMALGGRAAVLCGPPDVAKTSTALRLALGGAGYLTDEVAMVNLERLTVRGLARPLSLKGPIRSEVPGLRPPDSAHEGDRWLIPASSITHVVQECPLGLVAVLSMTGRRATKVLHGVRAIEHLVPVLFNHRDCTDEMLDLLVELAEQVPVIHLTHRGSLEAAAEVRRLMGVGA